MKVKDAIKLLQKHDPEKRLMIQQGEVYDYMEAMTIKEEELCDRDSIEEDIYVFVVIKYT